MAPKINIGRNDRVDFFGRTGSGKTTLARTFLRMSGIPFVVFDPKHRYTDGRTPIGTNFNKRRFEQIIRQPADLTGALEAEYWNELFYQVWQAGNRILYVDEVTLVNQSTRIMLPEYSRCVKTGRERGLGVWSGSQRPKDIPSPVFTEAEHFCIFRLQWKADREKVSSFTSDEIPPYLRALHRGGASRKHDWCYYNVDDDRIVEVFGTKER